MICASILYVIKYVDIRYINAWLSVTRSVSWWAVAERSRRCSGEATGESSPSSSAPCCSAGLLQVSQFQLLNLPLLLNCSAYCHSTVRGLHLPAVWVSWSNSREVQARCSEFHQSPADTSAYFREVLDFFLENLKFLKFFFSELKL